MAFFECTIGGASGDGVALIVQCDANFAGSTITADNGEDVFSETCPSVSPYTVRFEGIPTGTYTISGIVGGQTFTTQFTVLDYETTLNATPEGATVLPVNDIQIWLNCANIWDKNYTTISQVLADTTTLLTLVSSNNAADYMARSTSWASSVCANQTAMGYIGNNDYAADTLLADATWCEAICNSDYFESVLNAKVPTMTSDTTPSGRVLYSSQYGGAELGYYPFDGNNVTQWSTASSTTNPAHIGYMFASAVNVKKIYILRGNAYLFTFKLQYSDNGSSWTDTGLSGTTSPKSEYDFFNTNNSGAHKYWRLYLTSTVNNYYSIATIQFYGRA